MNRAIQEQQLQKPMAQQQQQSVTPDAIQVFAAAEGAILTSLTTALTAVANGVAALDKLINSFQNSTGTLSPADQTALDQIQATSNALLVQVQAINTTPPGQPVPITPAPTPNPAPTAKP